MATVQRGNCSYYYEEEEEAEAARSSSTSYSHQIGRAGGCCVAAVLRRHPPPPRPELAAAPVKCDARSRRRRRRRLLLPLLAAVGSRTAGGAPATRAGCCCAPRRRSDGGTSFFSGKSPLIVAVMMCLFALLLPAEMPVVFAADGAASSGAAAVSAAGADKAAAGQPHLGEKYGDSASPSAGYRYSRLRREIPAAAAGVGKGRILPRRRGHRQRRRSPSSRGYGGNSTTAANSAYVHRRRKRGGKGTYYTQLTDVLFCLAMALGWTVWMLSAFIRSDLTKYQKNSVLVRGHVLQVSVEDDSLGTGIPTYKAIIDYMVPRAPSSTFTSTGGTAGINRSNRTINTGTTSATPDVASAPAAAINNGGVGAGGCDDEEESKIQIRKQFETQKLLQEGFSNVELLVLPNEPTHSVLKEDWEKDWEEHQTYNDEWWHKPWFRRTSIAVAGCLVLASVAGAVHVVTRLKLEQRVYGWILICVGIAVLLPCAITVHYVSQIFQKLMNFQSEKTGIVISRDGCTRGSSRHNSRNNTPRPTPRSGGGGGGGFSASAGAAPPSTTGTTFCDDLDYLELDPQAVCPDGENETLGDGNGTAAKDYYQTYTPYHCHADAQTMISNGDDTAAGGGCYLIRFPTRKPQLSVVDSATNNEGSNGGGGNGNGSSHLVGDSSVSTVSSISIGDRSHRSTAASVGATPFFPFNIG